MLLLTTEKEALAEFRRVLPPSVESVLVASVEAAFVEIERTPADAVVLDMDDVAGTVSAGGDEFFEAPIEPISPISPY